MGLTSDVLRNPMTAEEVTSSSSIDQFFSQFQYDIRIIGYGLFLNFYIFCFLACRGSDLEQGAWHLWWRSGKAHSGLLLYSLLHLLYPQARNINKPFFLSAERCPHVLCLGWPPLSFGFPQGRGKLSTQQVPSPLLTLKKLKRCLVCPTNPISHASWGRLNAW